MAAERVRPSRGDAAHLIDPFRLVRGALHRLEPETAHELTLRVLELGLVPAQPSVDDPILATTLCGLPLANPIGLAAGFDKDARVYDRMASQGFGFVEVGGVTPRPQRGNARPRVFRLVEDEAIVNRMGFPNDGAVAVETRLRTNRRSAVPLGVNLAANADSADPAEDFVRLAERFAAHADYLTLDISCPNTANGRVLLDPARLSDLLARLAVLPRADGRPALLAKLSPDVDDTRLERLLAVLLEARIDGIVVANTTQDRPASLRSPLAAAPGGLSGRPFFVPSTALLARVRALTAAVPLVGVGGIASAEDAYAKIRAGASAVQLYTALVYQGAGLVTQIKRGLAQLLRRDGFTSLAEASGTGALPAVL